MKCIIFFLKEVHLELNMENRNGTHSGLKQERLTDFQKWGFKSIQLKNVGLTIASYSVILERIGQNKGRITHKTNFL